MFERADKFMAFTPYHIVAFTIFLNCDGGLHFGHSRTNMVTPKFFHTSQMIYPYRHFLKILQKS